MMSVNDLYYKYGMPLYIYSLEHILKRLKDFQNAFDNKCVIHYVMKANSNQAILTALVNNGCGMDIVSGGELKCAILSGTRQQVKLFIQELVKVMMN